MPKTQLLCTIQLKSKYYQSSLPKRIVGHMVKKKGIVGPFINWHSQTFHQTIYGQNQKKKTSCPTSMPTPPESEPQHETPTPLSSYLLHINNNNSNNNNCIFFFVWILFFMQLMKKENYLTGKKGNTLVVMTRKLKSTIKYDPSTRSNSKSNVTLATCNITHFSRLAMMPIIERKIKLCTITYFCFGTCIQY